MFRLAANEPNTALVVQQSLETRDVHRVDDLSTKTHGDYYNDGPPAASAGRR